MLRKNIKKCICILSAVIIAFSCFCVTASAVELTTTQGDFTINSVFVDNLNYSLVSAMPTVLSNSRTRLSLSFSGVIPAGTVFSLVVQFKLPDDWIGRTDGAYVGNYSILPDAYLHSTKNFSCWRAFPVQNPDEIQYFDGVSLDNDVWTFTYNTQPTKEVATVYNTSIQVEVIKASSSFNLYIYDLNSFKLIDWSLYSANTIIAEQQANTDKIIQSQQQNAELIIDNQNNNREYILKNQDDNAKAIQENQDKNFNNLFGILDNDSVNAPVPDTSITDNFAAQEQAVIDSTAQGREEINTVFSDAGSILSSADSIGRGLLAVTSIFNEFVGFDGLPWLSSLIRFSLILGMFSFVLGMSFLLLGRVGDDMRKDRALKREGKEDRIRHFQWYTGGKK